MNVATINKGREHYTSVNGERLFLWQKPRIGEPGSPREMDAAIVDMAPERHHQTLFEQRLDEHARTGPGTRRLREQQHELIA